MFQSFWERGCCMNLTDGTHETVSPTAGLLRDPEPYRPCVSSWGHTGPVLLLGYPRLAGGHGVCLVIQDLEKPLLSWLSILWWLGSSSCCHGNLAGLTARWTQSWHR